MFPSTHGGIAKPATDDLSSVAAPPCRGKVEKKGGVFRGPEREKNGSPWDFFRPQGVGAGKEEAIDAPPLKSR